MVTVAVARRLLWPALAALAILGVLWALARNRRPAAVDETVGAVTAPVPDVTWEWVSFTTPVEQIKVDSPDRYTVRFGNDGHVALKADCNRGRAPAL